MKSCKTISKAIPTKRNLFENIPILKTDSLKERDTKPFATCASTIPVRHEVVACI